MNGNQHPGDDGPSRREFLRGACIAAATSGVTAGQSGSAAVHTGASETLRVGLIGCGGRGTSAAVNAIRADNNVRLVAMADLFADRLQASRKRLESTIGANCVVDDDHCFVGFDAYQQLLDSGVDVVLLATPPHFRPTHLQAAVQQEPTDHCP